ncbi:hypothetical protein C8J57DRAFT_1726042 [Mycena rebaudengoi]|nr:hypothetical protein C8J57DRAFT_1726042 [Mycena rebaudengoi]
MSSRARPYRAPKNAVRTPSADNDLSSQAAHGVAEGYPLALTRASAAASFFVQDDDTTGHMQKMRAQVGSFCLVATGIFIVAEICRCPDNIFVLLVGGIPIAVLTVLSVMLGVAAQQLAKHKTIVTRITAFEELAGVTIVCSDKTIRSPRASLRLIGG